jgi:hypothetical protein
VSSRPVLVQRHVLYDTLRELRKRGWIHTERVALWLANRSDAALDVREMYIPEYEATSDYFHIGRTAMAKLMEHLRNARLMIGAQLHTHPAEAFHSAADDRWAIVRHAGALSVVVPHFARFTTPENFLEQAKVFRLSATNEWLEIPRHNLHNHLEIRA